MGGISQSEYWGPIKLWDSWPSCLLAKTHITLLWIGFPWLCRPMDLWVVSFDFVLLGLDFASA